MGKWEGGRVRVEESEWEVGRVGEWVGESGRARKVLVCKTIKLKVYVHYEGGGTTLQP